LALATVRDRLQDSTDPLAGYARVSQSLAKTRRACAFDADHGRTRTLPARWHPNCRQRSTSNRLGK